MDIKKSPTKTIEQQIAKTTILSRLSVSEYRSVLPLLTEHFTDQVAHFKAGRICEFYVQWQKITSNPEVLDMVKWTH